MQMLGLTATERASFEALLASHHRIVVQLTVMDLDHNEKTDVTNRLMDGQVTVDTTSAVTRSLDLELLDPTGALHLDSNSPDNGAMFADRMMQVRYCVINPSGSWRVNVPVFTGPITKLERNGAALRVECMGKETLGLAMPWQTKTFAAGYRTTQAILEILRDIMGENKLSIDSRADKLPRNLSVGTTTDKDGNRTTSDAPWVVAKKLAESIGCQLYYTGGGTATLRPLPENPCFTYREGAGGSMKSPPNAGFNIDAVVNCVEVFGKKPEKKDGKKQPHARVVAARSEPLSPWALGRSSGPRYLPLVIEDDSITTDDQAMDRANRELRRGLRSALDVSYDALVIPQLEELDVVRMASSKFTTTHLMKQFTIPLTAAGTATIGYVKNVKVNRSAIKQIQRRRLKAAS